VPAATVPGRDSLVQPLFEVPIMAKPHRKPKKANHGKRPANSHARRQKRREVRT
jgi:hypothetical protein